MNTNRKLANAIFWFHWIWIAILLGGVPMQYVLPWYKPVHMVVLTSTVVSQILWLGCPLVVLENALRAKYDPNQTYAGSFICYYLKKRFNIRVSPTIITVQLIAIVIVSVFMWL